MSLASSTTVSLNRQRLHATAANRQQARPRASMILGFRTLLALAFAISTTAALARSRDCAKPYDHRPDWYRVWQLDRLYNQRDGYYPDYRGCFPGLCRDDPHY
jgi:hypothetical protein